MSKETNSYKVKFEATIFGRGSTMSCKIGNMNIDTTATLEELGAMPDLDQVVGQLLQEDHPKLHIVMVKITDISQLQNP